MDAPAARPGKPGQGAWSRGFCPSYRACLNLRGFRGGVPQEACVEHIRAVGLSEKRWGGGGSKRLMISDNLILSSTQLNCIDYVST